MGNMGGNVKHVVEKRREDDEWFGIIEEFDQATYPDSYARAVQYARERSAGDRRSDYRVTRVEVLDVFPAAGAR